MQRGKEEWKRRPRIFDVDGLKKRGQAISKNVRPFTQGKGGKGRKNKDGFLINSSNKCPAYLARILKRFVDKGAKGENSDKEDRALNRWEPSTKGNSFLFQSRKTTTGAG